MKGASLLAALRAICAGRFLLFRQARIGPVLGLSPLIGVCNVGEMSAGKMRLDLFRKPAPSLGLTGPCFGQRRDLIGLENLGNIHLEMNKE